MNRHERRATKKQRNVAVSIDPGPALEKLMRAGRAGGAACVEFRDRLTIVKLRNGCLVLYDVRIKDKITGEKRDLTRDEELMLCAPIASRAEYAAAAALGLDFSGTEFVLTPPTDQTPLTQADVENILLQIERGSNITDSHQ